MKLIILKEKLPDRPLSGMINKHGHKVRLTFKFESDELWIATKGNFKLSYQEIR